MHPFFETNHPFGNVVLNFRGRAVNDLSAFAAGYHAAGMILVNKMESSHGYRDYDGYPILYLYRHALELYLKAIVYRGAQLLELISDERIKTDKLWTKHQLAPLLPSIKAIFQALHWEWNFEVSGLKSFDDFCALIKEIEKIDPQSYSFRYPINTRGDALHETHFVMNVIHFGKKMDPLLHLLSGAVTGVEEQWDATADVVYSLRELFKEHLY